MMIGGKILPLALLLMIIHGTAAGKEVLDNLKINTLQFQIHLYGCLLILGILAQPRTLCGPQKD